MIIVFNKTNIFFPQCSVGYRNWTTNNQFSRTYRRCYVTFIITRYENICFGCMRCLGQGNCDDQFYLLIIRIISFFLFFVSFGIYEKACVNKHFPAMSRISMLLPYVNRSFIIQFFFLFQLYRIIFCVFFLLDNSSFQMDRHLLQDLMMQLVVYSIFVLIKKQECIHMTILFVV